MSNFNKGGFVYILASKPNGTLYVGVTNDIVRRIREHRQGEGSEFVEEYDVTRLVHLERFDDIEQAIRREKQLKRGSGSGSWTSSARIIRPGTICTRRRAGPTDVNGARREDRPRRDEPRRIRTPSKPE